MARGGACILPYVAGTACTREIVKHPRKYHADLTDDHDPPARRRRRLQGFTWLTD